jgi:hypothetical protein
MNQTWSIFKVFACLYLLTAKNYTALAAPPAAAPPAAISARTHVMKVMRRHILRLVGIGAVTIAIPQLASAFNSETSAALKLAMGPVSAPQRRSVAPTTPDHTVTTCTPSEKSCPKPHHRSKRRRTGSAARTR